MKARLFLLAACALLAQGHAHAINAAYARQLERSGCTQVSEARFQPSIHSYAMKVPAVIERMAGLDRWVPAWSAGPAWSPLCQGEAGAAPYVPRWWRNGEIAWDEVN